MEGHAYTATTVRPRSITERSGSSGPAGALAVAGLCVLALALVWVFAELVPAVHVRDAAVLNDFARVDSAPMDWVAIHLIRLLEPLLFILWGIALVAVALARERPRTALAVAAVMGLAPLTSETLKPLLAHSHASIGTVHIGPASWPSGHTTAATALALCAVLVSPPRLRKLTAVPAAAFAAAVGVALLIRAAHMPSDVLAGYLVATFWAAVAVAAVRLADRRWPSPRAGAPV